MTENKSLTTKQRRLIAALLSESKNLDAAKKAGVSEATIYRWLEDPTFQAALRAAEGQAIDVATRQLVTLQDSAIETVKTIMTDTKTPAGVRLRAARTIIDSLLRLRELRNMEERLAQLENIIYAQNIIDPS